MDEVMKVGAESFHGCFKCSRGRRAAGAQETTEIDLKETLCRSIVAKKQRRRADAESRHFRIPKKNRMLREFLAFTEVVASKLLYKLQNCRIAKLKS